MAKEEKDTRTRNWVFILYPQDCFENWKSILDESGVEWIESPLHDKDTNEDAGHTLKKAHKHIALLYGSKKSYEQVLEFLQTLGETVTTENNTQAIKGVSIPQRIINLRGKIRYFAHLDNPEKYQYPQNEIIGHNGADPSTYLTLSGSNRYEVLRQMTKYIKEHEVGDFVDFADYCADSHFDDWFKLCCDNTMYLQSVCQSQWRKNQHKKKEPPKVTEEQEEYIESLAEDCLKSEE